MQLANAKIAKKLGLVSGGTVVVVVVLASLALWSIRAIHAVLEISKEQSHKIALVDQVWTDTGAIAQRVANMMVYRQFDSDSMEQIKATRVTRRAAFDEVKAAEVSEEGKRLLEQTQQIATQWGGANDQLLALLQAGKASEAARMYREQSVPRFSEVAATIASYKTLCDQNLAQIDEQTAALISRLTTAMIGFGLLAALMVVLLGALLARSIATPLAVVAAQLDQIAGGDVTRDVSQENLDRGDEIGNIGRSMQKMIVSLRHMIQEITGGIQVLASSSTELTATSTEMTSGSIRSSDKAHSVSAAAEEMSSNITSVAAGMEETTTNLSHVSSATEQMTSTIGEIAQNSEKARRITDEATRQAGRITEQINELGVAAHEIGKVTEAITEISSQTNLLALNATIEAARAGSAGKGFAVVATEIKALAQQTAAATEDIKGRIASVQSATAGGIAEIGKVSKIIHEVSEIVASIAAAIEQQATATKDIARNISEATLGVTDANTRVAETSQVSRQIAKDIVSVDQASGEMATNSDHVRTSAGELSTLAEALRVTVAHFHA
jgi:methyl-accepting chemotaxis protein